MTIGQRIAQKRKELGLSQEALGEKLGVSRQSIYKWESDTTLPEIEKLVALSRLFEVSVGWLLGVEDPPAAENSDSPQSDELTETQLNMVKEIVDRYLTAQPVSKPRRKWPWVLAVIVLVFAGFNLFNRFDMMDLRYQSLQNELQRVENSVAHQINGISGRVEEILKSQNNLTAEYDTEIAHTAYDRNLVVFDAYAIPKTYVTGMQAKFSADDGSGGIQFVEGELGSKEKFTGTLACQLTDNITLSVSFIYPDGRQETQVLDTYDGLYSQSLPFVEFLENLVSTPLPKPGHFTIPAPDNSPVGYIAIKPTPNQKTPAIESIQAGLFKNQKLVSWAKPCEKPESFDGFDDYDFYILPNLELQLKPGDTICYAAVITDEYGRKSICSSIPCILDQSGAYLTWADNSTLDTDLSHWTFD